MSDAQRSRPIRRDPRRGGYNRGFRREGPPGPAGPGVDYRALVEYVAKTLAEKPEEVQVEAFERGGGTVAIKVKLADGDVGRFIGKAGRNIEAVRTLVRVASLRDRKRVFVDLANPSLAHSSPRERREHGEGSRS
ncbi:MAG TPA: KH domain-containing protein [Candidatus Nitrosopolaris sp.]|nr:KH domain-containing protein [Candidatus Nitrosopolaris sp.]